MPEIIETIVYRLDELSDAAKDAARRQLWPYRGEIYRLKGCKVARSGSVGQKPGCAVPDDERFMLSVSPNGCRCSPRQRD